MDSICGWELIDVSSVPHSGGHGWWFGQMPSQPTRPHFTTSPKFYSTQHNQKKFCPEIGLYPYSTKTREALENTSLPTRDFLSAKPEGNLVGLGKS